MRKYEEQKDTYSTDLIPKQSECIISSLPLMLYFFMISLMSPQVLRANSHPCVDSLSVDLITMMPHCQYHKHLPVAVSVFTGCVR